MLKTNKNEKKEEHERDAQTLQIAPSKTTATPGQSLHEVGERVQNSGRLELDENQDRDAMGSV